MLREVKMNREESEKISYGRAVIEERKTLALTCIENIVSFDESFLLLDSRASLVSVEGEGLQILKMDVDSGEVIIVGKINALSYADKKKGVKRLGSIFRGGRRS